ncbi:MAG: acyltransferase family protein [Phycisphaerae bacterium]
MKQTSAPKLHALTTLRFFAAAMIVFHHSADLWGFPHTVGGRFNLSLAVSFFFELSGFILTYVYPSFESLEQRARFLLARFARIWPAHLAAFALLWLLLQSPNQFPTRYASAPLALLNLSLLHGWIPVWNVFFSFNPVSWTISTEFFFYLAFLFLNKNWNNSWYWKLPLTGALAIAAILATQLLHLPEGSAEHPWAVSSTGLLYINPIARLFEFTLGMCIAIPFRKTAGRVRLSKFAGTALELAALALVIANMYFVNNIISLAAQLFPNSPVPIWISVGPCCSLSFMLLIYVMALHAGYLSKILSTPLGVLLGEISYSVYLTHYVLLSFYRIHENAFANWPNWQAYALFWLIVLLTSWFVWAAIERPLRTWIVNRWPKHQKERAPSDAPPKSTPRFSLLQPRLPAILLVSAALLAALYPAYRAIAHQTRAEIQSMRAHALPDSQNIRFDNKLQLLAATLTPQPNSLQLNLAWQTIGPIPNDTLIAVHLVDNTGKILAQRDYPLHPTLSRPSPLPALTPIDPFWIDHIQLPLPTTLPTLTHIALAVYHKKGGMEPINTGPRDWQNHRLLLPLPNQGSP